MLKRIFTFLFLLGILQSLVSQTLDTLKVGYANAPPFLIKTNDGLDGVNGLLWGQMAKDLNLEYQLILMEFSDMLKALEEGTIDVSINPLTITSERSKNFNFTDSFYASNSTIAVIQLSGFQKLMMFVKSFLNVNFIKGLLGLLFIIFVFGFIGWLFERKHNPEHFRNGLRGIWDGLWWSAVTLTTVGYGDKAPQSPKGKIAALVLMFTGLLFISGLTASIASNLTVNQINRSTTNINDFKERSVGTVKSSSTIEYLKSRFFKNIKEYNNVELGLEDLKAKKIDAFIYDEPILKYRISQDSSFSKIEILPLKFDIQFYAFALSKKNESLEKLLSQKMLEIIESHQWQVILNEYGISEL